MISKTTARKRTNEAKAGLATVEKFIPWAAENKVWLPLGYDGPLEYWTAEFGSSTLASTVARVWLQYAAYEHGSTDEEIALAIPGVGPDEAALRRNHHEAGLSPKQSVDARRQRFDLADGFVPTAGYYQGKEPDTYCYRITVTLGQHEAYEKLAAAEGTTARKLADRLLHEGFAALAKRHQRKAA